MLAAKVICRGLVPSTAAAKHIEQSHQEPRTLRLRDPDFLFRWRGYLIAAGGVGFALLALPIRPQVVWCLIGLLLVLIGLWLRIWSRSAFAHGSNTRDIVAHHLFTGGPYQWCRNPLYVGNIALGSGMVLAVSSPGIAVGFGLYMFLIYNGMLASEERVLLKTHTGRYAKYSSLVRRWWPRVPSAEIPRDGRKARWPNALWRERKRAAGILAAWAIVFALSL